MIHFVLLTDDSVNDLEDIYHFVTLNESQSRADQVLFQIEKSLGSLANNPERGSYPPELVENGIKEYSEIHQKPYRFIYRIIREFVYVYAITDERRDIHTMLEQRLLNG